MSNVSKLSFNVNKGCLLGSLGVLAFSIIIVVAGCGLSIPSASIPSKDEIKNAVIENKSLFEYAITRTKKLDKYIGAIDHTKYYPADNNPSIMGLFTGGVLDGKYVQTPLEDEALDKLFLNVGVRRIAINDNCVEFFFGGSGRNYYCGAVWTADGNPVGLQVENSKLVPSGNGWEYREENGDNRYYTEKIIDHWYLYEEWY